MDLWKYPNFPKIDWKHFDVVDISNGDPDVVLHICEACGKEKIRYVHQLEHNSWKEIIEVGCICAGHLTGDIDKAKRLEKETRNRTSRRDRWIKRRSQLSRRGNRYLKYRHNGTRYHFIIFESKYGQWNFTATVEIPSHQIHDPSPYATESRLDSGFKSEKYKGTEWYGSLEDTKLALFDTFF